MSIQPYKGSERLIVEPQNPDGTLNVGGLAQLPTYANNCSLDDLYKHYFRETPDGVGTWEELSKWLSSKGWTVRARYW